MSIGIIIGILITIIVVGIIFLYIVNKFHIM